MRIIAYTSELKDGSTLIKENTGKEISSSSIEELLNFLVEPFENSIKICWSLPDFTAPILRQLDKPSCQKLWQNKRLTIPPYKIFYIPGKVFSLTHIPSRDTSSIYELEQYFPGVETPDIDTLTILGQKLMIELKKMGLTPHTLSSPIAIYNECILSKLDLPTVSDAPPQVLEYAYLASGKLWIEAHQLGYWEETYEYDMNSAFPTIAQHLIDPRGHLWLKDYSYHPEAIYGYIKAKVNISRDIALSPIITRLENGSLISPTGTFEEYLTKQELDFITQYNLGSYEILDGWWLIPQSETRSKPLYFPLAQILSYKGRTELQSLLAKRMSTGVYGKLGEEFTDTVGPHFFSPWFAEVSTQTRLRLAQFLYTYGIGPKFNEGYRSLLHIGVDNCHLDKPISQFTSNPHWKSSETPLLIISSGTTYTSKTHPKQLSLDQVLQKLRTHPKSTIYRWPVTRHITLGDALSMDRLSDLGSPITLNATINLLSVEHDRHFPRLPANGGSLLTYHFPSEPFHF